MEPGVTEIVTMKALEADPDLGKVNGGFEDNDSITKAYKPEGGQYVLKKDNSSVDFTLPDKNKGKEKGKSDEAYREKSRYITDGPYRGMGKEELLRFSSRPLWRNLRYACMSIVLTGWLALLITVVALVLTYPNCRQGHSKDWWQKTVVYRIYVRSFHDANGDGVGDLNGIRQKLEYLSDSGVDTISLSPIYKLPTNAPNDQHVLNHTEIDDVFGTMDDFVKLVNETHNKGMHILLDFIPNHTSDEHPWFAASKSNSDARANRFRSYYVWAKGQGNNGIEPPNNWKSVYGCSAWEYTTGANHYLHQFLDTMPDLNLRSEKVRDELENVLKFWLDMGVDGFYIRDSDFLVEDYDLRDDILVDPNATKTSPCAELPYNAYSHQHTRGLAEVFDMLARWRAFLDDIGNKTGSYKMLIADAEGSIDHVMRFYGLFNRDGVDLPLNTLSLQLTASDSGEGVKDLVTRWMNKMPAGRWANWMGGDDRSHRLVERLGEAMAMPYLMLAMLLPGTPFLYYGDEIGMHEIQPNRSTDSSNSRPMRGIMQWDNKKWAGFSEDMGEPWIEVHPNYQHKVNVKDQESDPYSMLNLFRNLTALRQSSPSFEYGDYVASTQDDQVFAFVREFDGEKGFLVALNFANETVHKHLSATHDTIPDHATIEVVSGTTSRRKGNILGLGPVTLDPYQGVVVSWDYQAKEL